MTNWDEWLKTLPEEDARKLAEAMEDLEDVFESKRRLAESDERLSSEEARKQLGLEEV